MVTFKKSIKTDGESKHQNPAIASSSLCHTERCQGLVVCRTGNERHEYLACKWRIGIYRKASVSLSLRESNECESNDDPESNYCEKAELRKTCPESTGDTKVQIEGVLGTPC
jgi:hypothetical protein